MDRQQVFAYVKKKYHTAPDYPWQDDNAVLRHADNKKWYGLIMEVSGRKLGLSTEEMVDILNVKCEPTLIDSLRTHPGIHPAYHMNKESWLSIRLDGSVEEEVIKNLIDLSFELTQAKKAPKGGQDRKTGQKEEGKMPGR